MGKRNHHPATQKSQIQGNTVANQRIPAEPVRAVAMFHAQNFSGPLPPSEMLAKYNDAFPGCAEKIVGMAEKQSDHRQKLEAKAVNAGILSERIGQFLGFVIALAMIGAGVYLTMNDKSTQGLAAIITPAVGLVATFIYGKMRQQKDLKGKNPPIERL